jgi:hypothetical protein
MDEWLSPSAYAAAGEVFTRFDIKDTVRGVSAAMDLFERTSAAAADALALAHRPGLAETARRHVLDVFGSL